MQKLLNYFEQYILEYDLRDRAIIINRPMPINEFLLLKSYVNEHLKYKIKDIRINSTKRR